MSYFDLLKDPRWQKKRLKIFEKNNWACSNCGSKEKPLNVHHGAYLKDKKPWEYPNVMLHCLCEDCHESATYEIALIKEMLGLLRIRDLKWVITSLVERIGIRTEGIDTILLMSRILKEVGKR